MPTPDADKQPGGGGGGHPARRHPRAGRRQVPGDLVGRKIEDARRSADVLDAVGDLLLLGAQVLGRVDIVELGVGLDSQRVHEPRQLVVACGATRAVRQVLARRGIERLADPLCDVAVEEPIVVQMDPQSDHGFPPRRARSLRAARNRWTRTVDSFNPVIVLTSRGVQSP